CSPLAYGLTDLLGRGSSNRISVHINAFEVVLRHAAGEFQSCMRRADRKNDIARSDHIGKILHVGEPGLLGTFLGCLATLTRGPDNAHTTCSSGRANVNAHITWMQDRKSTRLNSSHVKTSYAVFCLKKK